MGEVIYSTSLFKTFIWAFVIVFILIILGVSGVLNGLFRRNEKPFVRIARGCAGIFLFLVGVTLAFLAMQSIRNGSQVVTVHLNEKQIATGNCGDGDTCTRYVLETQAGTRFYDMDVNEETYNKAKVDTCYSVTYFPGSSLFSTSTDKNSYQSLTNITRIETVTCS
jgi:hypothetical protein